MTFDELIKSIGLNDDQAKQLTDGMKANKLFLSGEENIDVRYSKLKGDHETQGAQLTEAQKLIEQLKKDGETGAKAQAKIAEYEKEIAELKQANEAIRLDAAIKDALRDAKAKTDDFDYLIYRMKQDNKDISLGDDGKIKGIDDIVNTLKTAHPAQFDNEQSKKIDENKLPQGDPNKENQPQTLAEALKAAYENDMK